MDIETLKRGELSLSGGSRELLTTHDGSKVMGHATVVARVAADRMLIELDTSTSGAGRAWGGKRHAEDESTNRGAGETDPTDAIPPDSETDLSSLLGRVVGSGFRAAVDAVFGKVEDVGGPLHLLLDDLPAAALISGYAHLYSGKMQIESKHLKGGLLRADICSGWRNDGTMLVTLRERGQLPVPIGPPTTKLEPPDDPFSWHSIGPLSPGAMRRRRLVELAHSGGSAKSQDPGEKAGTKGREFSEPSESLEIYAMFRDTHVNDEGIESILHEYSLQANLDPLTSVISGCIATPHVLPWQECPAAAASASRLDGKRLDDIRSFVARDMRGTFTCTHLNDLLRSLSRVEGLFRHLAPTPSRT